MNQPWYSSTEKAKTLMIADFGPPEAVLDMAKPVRAAHTRMAAASILKELVKNGMMVSRLGLAARLSTKAIGKIVSNQAVNSSFSPLAHYSAAVNVDYLFANAIEPWKFALNPVKNNDGLKERHYLYAPLVYEGRLVVVKITVKKYINPELQNKLYSIEVIQI